MVIFFKSHLQKSGSLTCLLILYFQSLIIYHPKMQDDLPLTNSTFVFTGDMSFPREDGQSMVIKLGGRVTTAPSSKTTYLVVGDEPGPKKLEKANSLGIKIINEKSFMNLINKHSANFQDELPVQTGTGPKNISNEIWIEKYRPTKVQDLVGNANIIMQLKDFLLGNTKFKAALLSGHPGIGKTTCAHLVSKELGFEVIEFNASDTRNKTEIDKKMTCLNYFSLTPKCETRKKVVIMDEIDGMTSDRGGLGELNSLIKQSQTFIICICNDRSNPKLRTIGFNCLDLRFRKLMPVQILPRLKYILEQEGKQVRDNILNEVVKNSSGDIRFCINTLQNLMLRGTLSHEQTSLFVKKSITKNIFETATEIMSKKRVYEKLGLYFEDYSIIPLFIQDNYLKMNYKNIYEIMKAAESISYSDIVDKHIHGFNQEWSLLPLHAFYSSIYPVYNKNLTKRIDFPAFLGQRSKRMKNQRILSEIHLHGFKHLKMDKSEFRLYCLDLIFHNIVNNMTRGEIAASVQVLRDYDFLKTDYDNMAALVFDGETLLKNIGTKNKSAFTKQYKSLKRFLPYHVDEIKKIIKSESDEEDEMM